MRGGHLFPGQVTAPELDYLADGCVHVAAVGVGGLESRQGNAKGGLDPGSSLLDPSRYFSLLVMGRAIDAVATVVGFYLAVQTFPLSLVVHHRLGHFA